MLVVLIALCTPLSGCVSSSTVMTSSHVNGEKTDHKLEHQHVQFNQRAPSGTSVAGAAQEDQRRPRQPPRRCGEHSRQPARLKTQPRVSTSTARETQCIPWWAKPDGRYSCMSTATGAPAAACWPGCSDKATLLADHGRSHAVCTHLRQLLAVEVANHVLLGLLALRKSSRDTQPGQSALSIEAVRVPGLQSDSPARARACGAARSSAAPSRPGRRRRTDRLRTHAGINH
jgi:hypothetical protein